MLAGSGILALSILGGSGLLGMTRRVDQWTRPISKPEHRRFFRISWKVRRVLEKCAVSSTSKVAGAGNGYPKYSIVYSWKSTICPG